MIYLHIGRHKTGTTAIQRFLGINRCRLAEHSFLYPSAEWPEQGHHGVWMALQQRAGPTRAPLALPWLRPVNLEKFARLLHRAPNAIVSSEAFQGLNPADIVDVFPPGQTTVIVYLREQLDYLLTAYNQEVQSNLEVRSFEAFVEDTRLDYGPFLDIWAHVFGADHIVVRVYDRARLRGGSAVDDFINALGLDSMDDFIPLTDDPNLSLSAFLTITKRLLNRVLTPEEHRDWDLYSTFARLAALDAGPRRLAVPLQFSRALRAQYRADNAYVSERYFGSDRDVFSYVPVSYVSPLPTRSDVAAMLDRLHDLAPDAYRLLIETLAGDDLVRHLPEDERSLAQRIRGLRLRRSSCVEPHHGSASAT